MKIKIQKAGKIDEFLEITGLFRITNGDIVVGLKEGGTKVFEVEERVWIESLTTEKKD